MEIINMIKLHEFSTGRVFYVALHHILMLTPNMEGDEACGTCVGLAYGATEVDAAVIIVKESVEGILRAGSKVSRIITVTT